MNIIEQLEAEQMAAITAKRVVPEFGPGDTVKVMVKVIEGETVRTSGLSRASASPAPARGLNESFTVRKISYGEGVERVFPLYSPARRQDRSHPPRRGPPRQALLPARPPR